MDGPAPEHVEWVRRQLGHRSDPLLREMERDGAARGIPIMGPAAAGFVAGLARMRGAREILELGTATAYTSIWLGRVANETGGRLTTVERDPAMVREARANIAKAGLDGAVQVVEGDALAFLQEPHEGFELIVLDIEKDEYAAALPGCVDRLRPRGALVADNVSFAETREFQSVLLSDERLDTSLLYGFWPGHKPEWDTLSFSVRRLSGAGARVGPLG